MGLQGCKSPLHYCKSKLFIQDLLVAGRSFTSVAAQAASGLIIGVNIPRGYLIKTLLNNL